MTDSPIRLNKFIAQRLHLGRRAADDLISHNKVTINGAPAILGSRVHGGDTVYVQDSRLSWDDTGDFLYVLMDKPEGYVCSRRQQGATPTIYSLLPASYRHLKSVGRLDKDSSGLLLLTNDGDTAQHFTHPRFAKIKVYDVTLDRPLEPLHHQMISNHGIVLPDGPSKLQLAAPTNTNRTQWQVTMHEGRNRQIRRTFKTLGYTTVHLRRTQFGPFTLDTLGGKRLLQLPGVSENTTSSDPGAGR